MRKFAFVVFCVLVSGSAAMAQTVNTKWHCAAPTKQAAYDVGDVAGHTYLIAQGMCTATSSSSSMPEKTGAYTEFDENWTATYSQRGSFNVTLQNGDMMYYSYHAMGSTDVTKPVGNKWKVESGTGKAAGLTGSGSCTGMRNADGTSDWTCTGTTMMGASK
jgi:hypothetical protein